MTNNGFLREFFSSKIYIGSSKNAKERYNIVYLGKE